MCIRELVVRAGRPTFQRPRKHEPIDFRRISDIEKIREEKNVVGKGDERREATR